MPTISTCPRCSQMVSIPQGLDPATLVRCPLCGAEYLLNAAIDLAPPELIPAKTSDSANEVSAPPIVSSFLVQYGAGEADEGIAHPNFAAGDAEEIADTTESPLDSEVFDLITKHKQNAADDSSVQTESPGFGRRSQRKYKNVPRIFVEWIFGALSGIAIAYIALAWIMGSRFDLPAPPKVLKPVLRFVLPDRIWAEKEQPSNKH